MKKALIFDCDGVLGETERHGHLPAFNQMWAELGVPWQWSPEDYARKRQIAGGKERMASLFHDADFLRVFTPPRSQEERNALISRWHERKTSIYKRRIRLGQIPARPGVKRLATEALARGWALAVASTSAHESVEAVLWFTLGPEVAAQFSLVLAGDVVRSKKPAPDIYLLAAERLGIAPADSVAIEDSQQGVAAAVGAGMKCIVTVTDDTRGEDFSRADLVLTTLGEPGAERCAVLANDSSVRPGVLFSVDDLESLLGQTVAG